MTSQIKPRWGRRRGGGNTHFSMDNLHVGPKILPKIDFSEEKFHRKCSKEHF